MTMILQLIEKKTPVMFMLWSCSLKKVLTICHLWSENSLVFSITLILTNFTIKKLFTEHRFLKNTSAWLLLKSKFYSEFDPMFRLYEVRMLQKGFFPVVFNMVSKMISFAETMEQNRIE